MKRRNKVYTKYDIFEHNRFNHVSYKCKPWFKRASNVFGAPIRLKRSELFFNIRYKTRGMEHHTEDSYYYFDDLMKGRRYHFIMGRGIVETRTGKYVKKFDDDPILGW